MTTLRDGAVRHLRALRLSPAAGGGAAAGGLSRPSSCRRTCRAPARRPWRPRWRRRSSASSRPSPASPSMSSSSSLGSTQITLQFDLDRNIDAAAQDVQSALSVAPAPAARRDAGPAVLSQGQPGRRAHPVPGAHLRGPAAVDRGRLCRDPGGRAHLDRSRRGPGADLRPAEIRGARPGEPGCAVGARHRHRRGPPGARRHQFERAVRHADGQPPPAHPRRPRASSERRPTISR